MSRPLWLLIDASGWAHRDLYASPEWAFRNIVRRIELCRECFRPERIAIAFDSPRSFRRDLDAGYKANRDKDPPTGLLRLLDQIRDYAINAGDDSVEADGYEADDVIATLARVAIDQDRNAVIASADKDMNQCLVSGRVSMLLAIAAKPAGAGDQRPDCNFRTAASVVTKHGLRPDQWIDYQTLIGDSTDNIAGCPGIGPVAAKELLAKCDSIEGYFANPWTVKLTRKQAAKLTEFRRLALERTRTLVSLCTEVPLPAGWYEPSAGEVTL